MQPLEARIETKSKTGRLPASVESERIDKE